MYVDCLFCRCRIICTFAQCAKWRSSRFSTLFSILPSCIPFRTTTTDWFPTQDSYYDPDYTPHKSFWGMKGDGFCHPTARAGSSPVVNRNWHWGPKQHQTCADAYVSTDHSLRGS